MNIIVDSTFNPFSYKDLMQPVYDYKQAYEETEAAYSDLVAQTEAWKDIANRENSPEAYAMYKNYSDQLNAIVDDFSQGMNPRNRRQLLGMKRRYASEITPIARASEAMQAANALRDQAGPDAIFEVGRYNSIDDFLHGKTANNKFESRKDIAARTAALAQATAQSILEDPIIKQSMSPQFLEIIQKRGLGSLDELQAAIAGNPAAANRFAQIRNQMINQVGGLDRFDSAGRTAIEGAINEGLYAGLNNYQTSLQQNGEYMTKAQRVSASQQQQSLNLSRARFAYEKQKDQEARDMAAGRKPVAVDPDGTEHYTNGISTWTRKPSYEKKGNVAGSAYNGAYVYYDSKGNVKGWSHDANKSTWGDGTPVHKKVVSWSQSPIAPIKTKDTGTTPKSLGYVHGVDFPVTQGSHYGWKPGTEVVVDPENIPGNMLTPVGRGYRGLHSSERSYIESRVPQVAKHPENYSFYWAYYDKDDNICSKSDNPVRKQLIIKDKQE